MAGFFICRCAYELPVHRHPPLAHQDGLVVDWETTWRFHKETNGWPDLGYHYGIERVGDCILSQVERPESADA